MPTELTIDLFDESSKDTEALARLVDPARWRALISKASTMAPKLLSPEQWKKLGNDRKMGSSAIRANSQREAGAGEEDPSDPLADLIRELIEGP